MQLRRHYLREAEFDTETDSMVSGINGADAVKDAAMLKLYQQSAQFREAFARKIREPKKK